MAESISAKTAWALAKAIKGGSKKKLPNSGSATVVRIDQDGTHWVRISGSDVETPVNGAITAGTRPGDVVQYHLEDTRISITGNATSPSVGKEYVDDKVEPVEAKVDVVAKANALLNTATERARSVADAAKSVADAVNQHFFADTSGIHVTEATQDEWDTNHSGANVLINSIGQLFRDGLNNLLTLTTENGARALTVWDGLGNTSDHIRAIIGETIQLGNADSGNYMTLDDTGVEIYNESKSDGYSAKIGPAIVRLLGDSFNIETVIDGGMQRTYFDSIISHTVGKTSFIRLRTSQHRYIESDVASIITLHADALVLDGAVQRTEGTCTATTANATIISAANHCWTNNATTTITVGVNLKSSLANSSAVAIATAPADFRPPYTVVGSVYVTGQAVNLQAWIDNAGRITVNNRSGTSVTTSANIYISFTFAP